MRVSVGIKSDLGKALIANNSGSRSEERRVGKD